MRPPKTLGRPSQLPNPKSQFPKEPPTSNSQLGSWELEVFLGVGSWELPLHLWRWRQDLHRSGRGWRWNALLEDSDAQQAAQHAEHDARAEIEHEREDAERGAPGDLLHHVADFSGHVGVAGQDGVHPLLLERAGHHVDRN